MSSRKKEIEKKRSKPFSSKFIAGQIIVLKELGLPEELINRCKVRVMLQCETEEQAINLFSRMKLDYLLGKEWKP